MLDVAKLATLRAVVAHGSFSAAGHALSLTQPAVSRQVSLLERQLGTQLVRRTQQGVLPTEAGRLLVEHADAILGRLARAEAEVADVAGLRRGCASARSSPRSSTCRPSSPRCSRPATRTCSPPSRT